jgi:hypothetical protein
MNCHLDGKVDNTIIATIKERKDNEGCKIAKHEFGTRVYSSLG